MAELATIARPYANAVFDIAKSGGALEDWSRMLGVLASAQHEWLAQHEPRSFAPAKAGKLVSQEIV